MSEAVAAQTPDKVKAKKKDRDGSAKKRKREEQEQAVDAQVDGEPSTKKAKKRKSKGGDGETEDAVASPAAEVKEKKNKKKERKSDAADVEPAVEATPSKKHKSKKDRPSSANGLQTPGPSAASADTQRPATTFTDRDLEKHTPFTHQTASFCLSLSPCANAFPLEGLCAEHISPLLLTYYPPLKGVVLAYSNPRLSEHPEAGLTSTQNAVLAKSIDEYAVTYVWLTATFLLFRPAKGTYLVGYVNLQNRSMFGLMCYNYFNAGIDSTRLPKGWRWVSGDDAADEADGEDDDEEDGAKGRKKKALKEGEGYWADEDGKKVEGRIVFRVKDFEPTLSAEVGTIGGVNISGTLLDESEDGK
jgi:DNA-directed RNA polymerase I subunit RPA43